MTNNSSTVDHVGAPPTVVLRRILQGLIVVTHISARTIDNFGESWLQVDFLGKNQYRFKINRNLEGNCDQSNLFILADRSSDGAYFRSQMRIGWGGADIVNQCRMTRRPHLASCRFELERFRLSIVDHIVSLLEDQWDTIAEAIRECENVSSDTNVQIPVSEISNYDNVEEDRGQLASMKVNEPLVAALCNILSNDLPIFCFYNKRTQRIRVFRLVKIMDKWIRGERFGLASEIDLEDSHRVGDTREYFTVNASGVHFWKRYGSMSRRLGPFKDLAEVDMITIFIGFQMRARIRFDQLIDLAALRLRRRRKLAADKIPSEQFPRVTDPEPRPSLVPATRPFLRPEFYRATLQVGSAWFGPIALGDAIYVVRVEFEVDKVRYSNATNESICKCISGTKLVRTPKILKAFISALPHVYSRLIPDSDIENVLSSAWTAREVMRRRMLRAVLIKEAVQLHISLRSRRAQLDSVLGRIQRGLWKRTQLALDAEMECSRRSTKVDERATCT